MRTIKGPAIFLAQFAGDKAPFDTLDNICKWAADLGYKGVQIPTWVSHFVDVEKAATSKTYADEVKGTVNSHGLEITELCEPHHRPAGRGASGLRHAVRRLRHPRGARQSQGPAGVGGAARRCTALQASKNLGLKAHATFSGALAWPFLYPFPQRPAGLVEEAFDELARRWTPILDEFDEHGVDVCYEIHPGEDLHDGDTYEMFLERVNNHPRANLLYDPEPLRAAAARLPAVHRFLPRADQDVPRQGRRVQPDRQAGRLWRLPVLGEPGRALPLARRRPGRFRRHLLQAQRLRLRRLGGARMGMRHQDRRSRAQPKARRSSRATSSRSPRRPSTISLVGHRHGGQPQDSRL